MSDAHIAAFGAEWKRVIATFRRIESGDSDVRLTTLHRALAAAEKAFVLAYAGMDSIIAGRFRALILQARKLDEGNFATEARRFASQMEDAWLLLEVEQGVAGPKPVASDAREAPEKASSIASPPANAPERASAPTKADTLYAPSGERVTKHLSSTGRPQKALRLGGRWRDRIWVQLLGGLLCGLLAVGLVAFVAESMRTEAPNAPLPAPGLSSASGSRGRAAPLVSVATDGPFVSTSLREPIAAPVGDAIVDPIALLTWVESEYGRAPDGLGRLSDVSHALCSPDAHWRVSGKAGALADEVTLAGSLAVYRESANLLPGEVLYGQGGTSRALAMTYAMMAWRVGLEPVGVWMAEGRAAAVVDDSFCFGASPRTSPVRATETTRDCALALVAAVAEREAAAAVLHLRPLLRTLAAQGVGADRRSRIETLWQLSLARSVTNLDAPALQSLFVAVPELTDYPLSDASLRHVCVQLGADSVPLTILSACAKVSPELRFPDGSLLAEALIARLGASTETLEDGLAQVRESVVSGLAAAPNRMSFVRARLEGLGMRAEALVIGEMLWARNIRTWDVTALAMGQALGSGDGGRMLAVAIGAQMVFAEPSISSQTTDSTPNAAPTAAVHLLALALTIGDPELANRLAAIALARWPRDLVVWRLSAELFAAHERPARAVALLSQVVESHPTDEAARIRLQELSGD